MEKLEVINDDYLGNNHIKPDIKKGQQYDKIREYVCGCGEVHIDIGLKSKYESITCYKCKEELPGGDEIHWCNNIRFKKVTI